MKQDTNIPDTKVPDADAGLIRIMLEMTPEERIKYNDQTVNTILELRDAVQQQAKTGKSRLKPSH